MSVSAFAYGTVSGVAAGEVITLSGTSGTPNLSADAQAFPTDASAGWQFRSNGSVYYYNGVGFSLWMSGVEWSSFYPSPGTYYIRATTDSGSAPNSTVNTSDAVGSWLALSSNRSWYWNEAGVGTYAGVCKIEIATDSGGTNIVATGYYSGNAESS